MLKGQFAHATGGSRVLERFDDGMPSKILLMPREPGLYNGMRWGLDDVSASSIAEQLASRGLGYRFLIDWNHALENYTINDMDKHLAWGTWLPAVTEAGLEAHIEEWFAEAYDVLPNKKNDWKPKRAVLYWSPVVYGVQVEVDGQTVAMVREVGPLALTNQPGTHEIARFSAQCRAGKESNTGYLKGQAMPTITMDVPEALMSRVPDGAVPVGYFPPMGLLVAMGSSLLVVTETGEQKQLAPVEAEDEMSAAALEASSAAVKAAKTAAVNEVLKKQLEHLTASYQADSAQLKQLLAAKLEGEISAFCMEQLARGIFTSQEDALAQKQKLLSMPAEAREAVKAALSALPSRVTAATPAVPASKGGWNGIATYQAFTALPPEQQRGLMAEPGALARFTALQMK